MECIVLFVWTRNDFTSQKKEEHSTFLMEKKTKEIRQIKAVTFLCAVTRPRFDDNGEVLFDGKIGILLFVGTVVAKHDSQNWVSGTSELRCMKVTRL